MKITVYKSDIKRHVRHDPERACVCFAARRTLEGHAVVTAGYDCLHVDGKVYSVPKRVTDSLIALDAGWPEFVKPFSVELEEYHETA